MIGILSADLEAAGQVLPAGSVVNYSFTSDKRGMVIANFPGVWPTGFLKTAAPRTDNAVTPALFLGHIKYQAYYEQSLIPSVGRSVESTIRAILKAFRRVSTDAQKAGTTIDGVLTAFGIPDTAEYENYYAYVFVQETAPPNKPHGPSGLATVCWLKPSDMSIQKSVDGGPWQLIEHYADFYSA